MAKTNFHELAVLNTARGTNLTAWTPYVALFTAVTDAEAGTVTEVAVTRILATFGAPAAAGSMTNSGTVTFAAAGSNLGTVTHFGLFDAVSGGNLRYVGALSSSFAYNTGVQPSFAVGALTVSES